MSSSTTEVMEEAKGATARRKLINANLISLKCLLFFFFGAMGCLLPFLPLHMLAVGLSPREIRTISMIAPAVSIIGPLLAGPIADRVAASRFRRQQQQQQHDGGLQSAAAAVESNGGVGKSGRRSRSPGGNGRYLRVMIAACCLFSALFYCLLLVVPAVERVELPHELRPAVGFSCDADGALVHQERCRDAVGCHRWSNEDRVGSLLLQRCEYACYPSTGDKGRLLGARFRASATPPPFDAAGVGGESTSTSLPADQAADFESSGELGVVPLEGGFSSAEQQQQQSVKGLGEASGGDSSSGGASQTPTARPGADVSNAPRVCYRDGLGRVVCHVFPARGAGPSRGGLRLNASLGQALNPEDTGDWCAYPVAQRVECRIPEGLAGPNRSCHVECQLEEPYDEDFVQDNVLAESQCRQVIGNEQLTFWMYLAIRSLADIFPTAAVALLDAAIVIATRETSTGRGDVGRQLAFGSLGFCLFGPLGGYLAGLDYPGSAGVYAPILLHGLLALVAACVALSADAMPLSPPEWWWHTRSGMLAVPMSTVRRYGGESAALFFVLVVMGGFWSAMDTYLSIHLIHLRADELSIGLALTLGALPAVLFLWKSEHLVDYCGHSNLLITAFIIYIVRFTGLSLIPDVWWALISEALELFTLGVMWVTAILYFRHLIPRQMTATGQALAVIAHFCIGRAIGAVIGACVDKIGRDDEVEAMRYIYQCMAIAAAAIATLYFVLYHGILKPRCHAQTVYSGGGQRQPPTIAQAINGNGNYTPLRVYHNGMGRKGQFRY